MKGLVISQVLFILSSVSTTLSLSGTTLKRSIQFCHLHFSKLGPEGMVAKGVPVVPRTLFTFRQLVIYRPDKAIVLGVRVLHCLRDGKGLFDESAKRFR